MAAEPTGTVGGHHSGGRGTWARTEFLGAQATNGVLDDQLAGLYRTI